MPVRSGRESTSETLACSWCPESRSRCVTPGHDDALRRQGNARGWPPEPLERLLATVANSAGVRLVVTTAAHETLRRKLASLAVAVLSSFRIGRVRERLGGLLRHYHRAASAVANGTREPTAISSDRRGRDLYPATDLGRVRQRLLASGLLLPCVSRPKAVGPVFGHHGRRAWRTASAHFSCTGAHYTTLTILKPWPQRATKRARRGSRYSIARRSETPPDFTMT
jgi:hypothetical protein